MAFTDVGNGGRIYDVGETARLDDALNQLDAGFKGLEKSNTVKKDIIRYSIIAVGSVLILVLLSFAVKKRKK